MTKTQSKVVLTPLDKELSQKQGMSRTKRVASGFFTLKGSKTNDNTNENSVKDALDSNAFKTSAIQTARQTTKDPPLLANEVDKNS